MAVSCNVHVSPLPDNADEQAVRQLFAPYGAVESLKVIPRNGGIPTHGFVKFQTPDMARYAIDGLRGYQWEGNVLTLRLTSNEPPEAYKGGGGPPANPGQPQVNPGSYGKGEYGKGEYGKGEYGKGEYGKGEYGKGEYGKGEYGKGEFGKGEYGKGEYSKGEYGKGEYGKGEYGKGEYGKGEYGKGYQGLPVPPVAGQCNVYVAGIPEACSELEFRDFFSRYGSVTSVKLSDQTKNGTRYGFVNFGTSEEASKAIAATNNYQLGQCVLTVRFANNTKGHGKGPSGPAMVMGGYAEEWPKYPPSDVIVVQGLSANLTEDNVKTVFMNYGQVLQVKILEQYEGLLSVEIKMATVEQAEWIVGKLDGNIPHTLETPVAVFFAPPNGAPVRPLSSRFSTYGGMQATSQPKSPATPEFQKAVSDTIAAVKGYKPVTDLGDQPDPSYLIIRGLSADIDELYLYYVFAPFGAIQSIQVIKDEKSGACTGTAYVKFGIAEDALLAIQTICGNPLPDGSTIGVFVKPGQGGAA